MSEATIDRRSGLANVIDIIVSPNSAFDRLRQVPTWGWPYLIVTALGVIGTVLVVPALEHALDTSLPAKLASMPQIARLPADQQQHVIELQLKISKTILGFFWLFVPIQVLLIGLVQGLIMTIANAVGGGDGTFKKYYALSINVAVVGFALAAVVLGIIVQVRGPNSFEEQSAVTGALPSLALLAPGVKGGLAGFFGQLNIFTLWATALLAFGMERVGRVRPVVAWTFAALMLLLNAGFAAWGAAQNG